MCILIRGFSKPLAQYNMQSGVVTTIMEKAFENNAREGENVIIP